MSATYDPVNIVTNLRDFLRAKLGDTVGWDGTNGGDVIDALVLDEEYDGVLLAFASDVREGAAQAAEMYAGRTLRGSSAGGDIKKYSVGRGDEEVEHFDPARGNAATYDFAMALAARFRSGNVPGFDVFLAASLQAGSPPMPTACTDLRLLGMPTETDLTVVPTCR